MLFLPALLVVTFAPVGLDAMGVEVDSNEFQIDLSASGFTIESSFFPSER
jgi:hypothetical protein